jgi:hypothetical protein
MTDVYAELEEYAREIFPKIPVSIISKTVREVVEETERLRDEGLTNESGSDSESILRILREKYNIKSDSQTIKKTYEMTTKGKEQLTEKEKLSATITVIGSFKLFADLTRYELELQKQDI